MKNTATKSYPACSCRDCTSGCLRAPGWFTPEEANKAMDAGRAPQMMLDWMTKENRPPRFVKNNTYILAPAVLGCEGHLAPECDGLDALLGLWRKGRCVWLSGDMKCEIHDSGYKPLQCRSATHNDEEFVDNYQMAVIWDTNEGKATVARWRKLTGCVYDRFV